MSDDVDYPQGCQPINNSTNISQNTNRLRALAACLYDCLPNNSEEVQQPTRFQSLFTHLSQECFLDVSNTDFRLYLSLCLAHILRVFQPELPTVSPLDLKDTYLYIFRTLRGLGDVPTDNPKFKNYFQLVEALGQILHPLSEMKDYDDKEATPVFRALIKDILAIPCGKGWRRNLKKEYADRDGEEEGEEDENAAEKIKNGLITIASSAIGELDYVPNEILDVLFYHIVPPQRENFVEARDLAQNIIVTCSENGNNPLTSSIRTLMAAAVREGEFPDDFQLTGAANRSKFFSTIRSLQNLPGDFVSGAVQDLSFWLRCENKEYRKEAVQVVGKLAADVNGQFGLDSGDVTWTAFLNSAHDSDDQVRLEFVERSTAILLSKHSHLRASIIQNLIALTKDPSEEVRKCVVHNVNIVVMKNLDIISDRLLQACADRMKDLKPSVRDISVRTTMKLYDHVMSPSMPSDPSPKPSYTESDKECVRFIPSAVLKIYYIAQSQPTLSDTRITIERYIQMHFVRHDIPARARVRILADWFRSIDEIEIAMFNTIIVRSAGLRRGMIDMLSLVSSSSEDEKLQQVLDAIKKIASYFPESVLLEKVLKRYVNELSKDPKLFDAQKQLLKESFTAKQNYQALALLTAQMETKFKGKMYNMLRHSLVRMAPLSFDVELAKELVVLVAETVAGVVQLKTNAQKHLTRDVGLLRLLTTHFPHIFIGDDIVDEIRSSLLSTDEPKAAEAALSALNRIFHNSVFRQRLEEEETRKEKWFLTMKKDLKELIVRDESAYRRSAKLATRLVAVMVGKQQALEYFDGIFETLTSRLQIDCESAPNAFQVLSEVLQVDPDHFLTRLVEIVESHAIPLLTSPEFSPEDVLVEHLHFDKQPWPQFTMARVYAAKFVTKVLQKVSVVSGDEQKSLVQLAPKLVQILAEFVEKKGVLGEEQSSVEKARLRATAAACLLKIASQKLLRPTINVDLFKHLSYQLTDQVVIVRKHYLDHVTKELKNGLPIEFAACFALAGLAFTEEDEKGKAGRVFSFKGQTLGHMQNIFEARSEKTAEKRGINARYWAQFCSETVVAYSIWLIANFDGFDKVEENATEYDEEEELDTKARNVELLAEFQECLWFVVDAQKRAGCNMQTVFKVLEQVKTFGDKQMGQVKKLGKEHMLQHNKKMWALADLTITMMVYRAKLQMEDTSTTEPSYNTHFFYKCSSREQPDPSICFAPDILMNDEVHRSGRIPKFRRVFRSTDLIPAKKSEESHSASKRGARKMKVEKKKTRKLEDVEEEEEEREEEEEEQEIVPKRRRSGGKRKKVEEEEEDDDEDDEEVMPVPKKRNSGRNQLDDIALSPILQEGVTRRSSRNATMTSSTPLVVTNSKPKNGGSKRKNGVETPKKRTSDVTSSPKKLKTVSPRKNKYGFPIDEHEESKNTKSPSRLGSRSSARLSKK